uniref:Uncharacterized protein n=1 Tax=Aegilops tauschii subsp. strangulata TaxID=200361 RepID=A0A453MLR1_AEGTS
MLVLTTKLVPLHNYFFCTKFLDLLLQISGVCVFAASIPVRELLKEYHLLQEGSTLTLNENLADRRKCGHKRVSIVTFAGGTLQVENR